MVQASREIAIVEIGSTGMRLIIASIDEQQQWKILDRAGKSLAMGKDVFTTGQITWESLLECISALQNFRELMKSWEIADANIHIIATSALRAARNRDIFMDRVFQETGFLVKIVDGIEENRLMYLGVRYALRQDLPEFREGNSMIVEAGGGSTEIILLNQGKIVAAHSLNIGTIMIDRIGRRPLGSIRSSERYLTETIRKTSGFLKEEMELANAKTFVIIGTDAWILATRIGRELNDQCRIISREDFLAFAETIRSYTIEDCVKKLQIPHSDAPRFIIGNLVYKLFLERTAASQVAIPNISIREGYLVDLTMGVDPELQEEFYSQIIASAVNLGRKYRFDEAHNCHVSELCLMLFDFLAGKHGMTRRERMLLEVAAILHDVGEFIENSEHHKHSQYIVNNSEIFGISAEEQGIIANAVRYHRGDAPSSSDFAFAVLQREERIVVLKIIALLRVADALDRSHSQHITGDIRLDQRGDSIFFHTSGNLDLSSEQRALDEKADMFRDVFGYKVHLT